MCGWLKLHNDLSGFNLELFRLTCCTAVPMSEGVPTL